MANTYLSRTSSTPTNALKWTFSAWVKISGIANDTFLLDFNTDTNNRSQIGFSNDSSEPRLMVYEKVSGSTSQLITTSRLFRDPSAWYHIVVSCDRTLATSSDRTKIYVNGVQETSFTSATYPTQNVTGIINTAVSTLIGKYSQSTLYFDGCLAHYHFIDGTAYEASDFGETDATTGIWKPKLSPSVTYGTNGFFLKFNEGALGTDSSPNGNNFTVNGSLTPTKDTPENVFTTWNPLENYYQSATLSNGNTTIQTGSSQYSPSSSTLGVSSGKWYWEVEYDALSGGSDVAYVGVLSQFATNSTTSLGTNANDYGYYVNGNYYNNNTGTAYGTTYTTGDIIGVALDLDNNKLYFSKNGTWQNSGDPESGATGTGAISITNPTSTTNGAYFPSICDGSSSANATFKTNFGNGYFGTTAVASAGSNGNGAIFEYDCPSGYYALNTKNINTYG
jgi:hypothetical protein